MGVLAADGSVEGDAEFFGGGTGDGQRDAEDGVGAEATLVVSSVGVEHGPVDGALVEGVEAENGPGEFGIDVGDGGGDTLAGPSVAAVTQLDGLVPAGRGTARDDCPAGCATLEEHLGLERGVATGVEDLTGDDERDAAHCAAPRYSD